MNPKKQISTQAKRAGFLGLLGLLCLAPRLLAQCPVKQGAIIQNGRALSIPMELIAGVPFIHLRVNEVSERLFVLDSGTSSTLLNSDRLTEMHVLEEPLSKLMVNGSGDTDRAHGVYTKLVEVEQDNHLLISGRVGAISLKSLEMVVARPISGIIGFDFFAGRIITIDFEKLVVELANSSRRGRGSTELRSVLGIQNGLPFILADLSYGSIRAPKVRLVLDSGSQSALVLTQPFAASHDLFRLAGLRQLTRLGFNGSHSGLTGVGGSLDLNGFKFDVPNIILSEAEQGLTASTQIDGLLGLGNLRLGCVVIDADHDRAGFWPAIGASVSRSTTVQ